MIITICAGRDNSYVVLKNKRLEFVNAYNGDSVKVSSIYFYKALAEISEWCNNELNEPCMFEVD